MRLEPVRRLKLEVKERRQRTQAMFLLRRDEDHRTRTNRRHAFRRLDLRVAFDDEVKMLADLMVVERRRRPLGVRHHAGEHVVDVREFLVDEERADATTGRSLEPRQLVLMEDVGQSALLTQRSTGITVPAKTSHY